VVAEAGVVAFRPTGRSAASRRGWWWSGDVSAETSGAGEGFAVAGVVAFRPTGRSAVSRRGCGWDGDVSAETRRRSQMILRISSSVKLSRMSSLARSRTLRVLRPRKSILSRPIFSTVGPSHWVTRMPVSAVRPCFAFPLPLPLPGPTPLPAPLAPSRRARSAWGLARARGTRFSSGWVAMTTPAAWTPEWRTMPSSRRAVS
jgi:hypothetical protein